MGHLLQQPHLRLPQWPFYKPLHLSLHHDFHDPTTILHLCLLLRTVNLYEFQRIRRQATSVVTVGLNVPVSSEDPVEVALQDWVDVRTGAKDVLAPGVTSNQRTSIEQTV